MDELGACDQGGRGGGRVRGYMMLHLFCSPSLLCSTLMVPGLERENMFSRLTHYDPTYLVEMGNHGVDAMDCLEENPVHFPWASPN